MYTLAIVSYEVKLLISKHFILFDYLKFLLFSVHIFKLSHILSCICLESIYSIIPIFIIHHFIFPLYIIINKVFFIWEYHHFILGKSTRFSETNINSKTTIISQEVAVKCILKLNEYSRNVESQIRSESDSVTRIGFRLFSLLSHFPCN